MARWKTVFECEDCKYYKTSNGGKEKFCHYALDTGLCRVMNNKSVPAEKCYKNKVFFEEKQL